MDKAFQQLFLRGNVGVRQYYVAHRPLVVNTCTNENYYIFMTFQLKIKIYF